MSKRKRKDTAPQPSEIFLFFACVAFALLNLAALRTGWEVLSWLSVIPFAYVVFAFISKFI